MLLKPMSILSVVFQTSWRRGRGGYGILLCITGYFSSYLLETNPSIAWEVVTMNNDAIAKSFLRKIWDPFNVSIKEAFEDREDRHYKLGCSE